VSCISYLIENGFEIWKSGNTVDSIIKNINKQKEFLSQNIINGIENIFIGFFNIILNPISILNLTL
tara:strand:+ start:260 stop:457 length:198 start_codon:yes stop_codon:yes gene_type:complete